jgi:hypothetical protein
MQWSSNITKVKIPPIFGYSAVVIYHHPTMYKQNWGSMVLPMRGIGDIGPRMTYI